jgi:hypothetical protein
MRQICNAVFAFVCIAYDHVTYLDAKESSEKVKNIIL